MKTAPIVNEQICCPAPDALQLKGFIGQRFDLSRTNRLPFQEEDHLLWPFKEHCPVGFNVPGRPHPEIRGDWQGEYLGTWLDAAILTAWNASDPALRAKIDHMVNEWLSTQQEDGYLGTYDEKDRWKSWDVWVQAHDLIGLISYYHYTHDEKILHAAIRVADRVLMDFGSGKRYLYPTGPHGGMASSSFLEPLIWLYWETGDQRYLDWGRWLVEEDWEQPDGPRITSSLMGGRGVAGTANAKGIEMLICFAGMVEMYRATGERRYLDPVLVAWQDIVEHQLYITGSASTGEYFMKDYLLRNDGLYFLGETCVSMGWLYLNLKLGRLLGEARFFDMAEQTLYNHLLSAQSRDGRGWAYYLGLRDHKRYRWHVDPECCPTRGVRALAQMPTHAVGVQADGLVLNFYDALDGRVHLPAGEEVGIKITGNYPFEEQVKVELNPIQEQSFAVYARLPGWCKSWSVKLNGSQLDTQPGEAGYLRIQRQWQPGDQLNFTFALPVKAVTDRIGNVGRLALVRGPLVYAADAAYLPSGRFLDDMITLVDAQKGIQDVKIVQDEASGFPHLLIPAASIEPVHGQGWWVEKERYGELDHLQKVSQDGTIRLVPFVDAGNRDADVYRDGFNIHNERVARITFQVWIPFVISE